MLKNFCLTWFNLILVGLIRPSYPQIITFQLPKEWDLPKTTCLHDRASIWVFITEQLRRMNIPNGISGNRDFSFLSLTLLVFTNPPFLFSPSFFSSPPSFFSPPFLPPSFLSPSFLSSFLSSFFYGTISTCFLVFLWIYSTNLLGSIVPFTITVWFFTSSSADCTPVDHR